MATRCAAFWRPMNAVLTASSTWPKCRSAHRSVAAPSIRQLLILARCCNSRESLTSCDGTALQEEAGVADALQNRISPGAKRKMAVSTEPRHPQ